MRKNASNIPKETMLGNFIAPSNGHAIYIQNTFNDYLFYSFVNGEFEGTNWVNDIIKSALLMNPDYVARSFYYSKGDVVPTVLSY